MNQKGIVFNIQHFSVHDGPGIRTVVFLKGCPLRCKWCSNPESQRFSPELGWNKGSCIGCKDCEKKIKSVDCYFKEDGLYWKQDGMISNEEVEKICPSTALHVIGKEKSVEEVISSVEQDKVFYGEDGGMTLSGGEPLAQPAFAITLLKEAKKREISCAIETTGFVKWEIIKQAAEYMDDWLTDIKCINDEKHKKYTGVSNQLILENIKKLVLEFPKLFIQVRTPVIPNFNDDEQSIKEIAKFLNGLNRTKQVKWELLKYHRLGIPKYESLHREYEMTQEELSQEKFDNLHEIAKKYYKNTI